MTIIIFTSDRARKRLHVWALPQQVQPYCRYLTMGLTTAHETQPRHVPCATRPRARRSVEERDTYLHTCYDHEHARTIVPTTSEAPLSCRPSTYSILHIPINNRFVYARDYTLPGFRANARLHQRRHHRQEVCVDILHVTTVPSLTSNS